MKSETERVEPQLPCPQCRELMPLDSKFCSVCGAEVYAQCPDCGTRRSADDAFCRKCGFNFSRKKLRLRRETPVADTPPETAPTVPLPRASFREPEKRSVYRLTPLGTAFRIMATLLFLVLAAAAGFWVVNWALGNVRGKDIVETIKRIPARISGHGSVPERPVEPDWKFRYDYWFGYYRDAFSPVGTHTWVEVCTTTGIRERGILIQVTNNTILLRKEGQELGFPRALLDNKTRQAFFPEEYASANAKAKVEAEKAEWKKQIEQQAAVPQPESRFSCSSRPADSAVSNAPPPPPPRTYVDVRCPVCSGQGFYLMQVVDEKKGVKDKASVIRDERESCPVCGGKGYRRFEKYPEFPWPVGASRCRECQGMGVKWYRMDQASKKGVVKTLICRTCNHSGYVVNKWDAAHNVPPRYE